MSIPTSTAATASYAFNPSAADVTLNAFALACIRPAEIETQHLRDAAFQFNALMIDVTNRNPNAWEQELVSQVLTAGTATYTLPGRTLIVSPAMLSMTDGSGNITERMLGPISRFDYATYPNKALQSQPTSILFSLTNPPSFTVYPTPDMAQTYQVNCYTFRQTQDTDLSNGYSVDAPYRAIDAITTGLAARIAEMYPENIIKLKGAAAIDRLHAQYEDRFRRFAAMDQESVPLAIVPGISAYLR